jgi:hypothetical protein
MCAFFSLVLANHGIHFAFLIFSPHMCLDWLYTPALVRTFSLILKHGPWLLPCARASVYPQHRLFLILHYGKFLGVSLLHTFLIYTLSSPSKYITHYTRSIAILDGFYFARNTVPHTPSFCRNAILFCTLLQPPSPTASTWLADYCTHD